MNILNIEHIHKIFGDKVIFDDISCGIDQGEKIGIIGVNGTGKTTLLRVIAGEEEPDEGQGITQNGIQISWLPQTPEFPQHMTILDYVAEGKWQKDWSTESEARRMLNTLGITDQNINMDNLSGGEKKRNEIFQMAMLQPRLSILDETDSGLDIDALRIVSQGVNQLKSDKNATIVITHYQRLLDYIAPDFVHVLYKGRIVKSGGPELALELEEKGYDWIKKEVGE